MRNIFLFIIAAVIILAGLVLGASLFMRGPQELNETNVIPFEVADYIESKSDHIVLHEPQPLSVIKSPVTVLGKARGTWYFEADFQVVLVDWDGRIIAESFASAILNPDDPESTWMTEEFVPFRALIEFPNPSFSGVDEYHFSRRGALILQKANPSGLSEYDDALEIPILFEI